MKNPNDVIYNGLIPEVLFGNRETSYAIALLRLKDGSEKLGFRWNGDEGENDVGTPAAHGKPTWMLIPEDFLEKLGFALDKLRKRKEKPSN